MALLGDSAGDVEVVDLSARDTEQVTTAIGELIRCQDEEWGARRKAAGPRSRPPRRAHRAEADMIDEV